MSNVERSTSGFGRQSLPPDTRREAVIQVPIGRVVEVNPLDPSDPDHQPVVLHDPVTDPLSSPIGDELTSNRHGLLTGWRTTRTMLVDARIAGQRGDRVDIGGRHHAQPQTRGSNQRHVTAHRTMIAYRVSACPSGLPTFQHWQGSVFARGHARTPRGATSVQRSGRIAAANWSAVSGEGVAGRSVRAFRTPRRPGRGLPIPPRPRPRPKVPRPATGSGEVPPSGS